MSFTLSRLVPPSQRERTREVRDYLRRPLVLRTAGPSSLPHVVLYGVPYADWNEAFASPSVWTGIASRVIRMPAIRVAWRLCPVMKGAIVIPMKEAHAKDMPRGVPALSPSPTAVHTLMDKARFARYMEANGFDDYCPRTYTDWARAEFPGVLKRTDCASSYAITLVTSLAEVEALLKEPAYSKGDSILQEAIPGTTEYCTYCVLKEGRVLWSRTFLNDIATSLTIRTEDNVLRQRLMETPQTILEQIEAILMPLAYSGPCNIDYKLQGDRMRVFEINPRFGGTLIQEEFRAEFKEALACIVRNATVR